MSVAQAWRREWAVTLCGRARHAAVHPYLLPQVIGVERRALHGEEQLSDAGGLAALGQMHGPHLSDVLGEERERRAADRHQPVPARLPLHDTDQALIEVHVVKRQPAHFAAPQSRGVKQLEDGAVAEPVRLLQVGSLQQPDDLVRGHDPLGQPLRFAQRRQRRARIDQDFAALVEHGVKVLQRPHELVLVRLRAGLAIGLPLLREVALVTAHVVEGHVAPVVDLVGLQPQHEVGDGLLLEVDRAVGHVLLAQASDVKLDGLVSRHSCPGTSPASPATFLWGGFVRGLSTGRPSRRGGNAAS